MPLDSPSNDQPRPRQETSIVHSTTSLVPSLDGQVLFDSEHPQAETQPAIRTPEIDLTRIANGLIQGGADTVSTRFNLGIHGTFDQVCDLLAAQFSQPNIYIRPLNNSFRETAGLATYAGFYFEASGSEIRNALALPPTASESPGGVPFARVSDQTRRAVFQGGEKPVSGSLREKIAIGKESLRRRIRRAPLCCGNVVVIPYGQDAALVRFAISGKMDLVESFARFGEFNRDHSGYKVFGTSYLVDKPKPITDTIDDATLSTLAGHAKGLHFRMSCKIDSFEWVRDIQQRYGLVASGGLLDKDSGCFLADQHVALRLPDVEGMVILRHNYVYESPQSLTLTLENFTNGALADCFRDILSELKARGAVTRKHASFRNLYMDLTSTYLPDFPLATQECLTLSYPGSLSDLGKD